MDDLEQGLADLKAEMVAELSRERNELIERHTMATRDELRADTSAALGAHVAKSWRGEVREPGTFEAFGLVWSRWKAMARAHLGVTITANRRTFLAIPTDAAPAGRRRAKARPTEVPGLEFRPMPNGRGLLVKRGARRSADVVMFILVPSVRLPRRLNWPAIMERRFAEFRREAEERGYTVVEPGEVWP